MAQAKAEKAKQEATIMVGTEIEADRKRTEAKGIKDAAITKAEGEAEAKLLVAKAEAESIRLKKLAEAEGEKQMAEAEKIRMQAETENIANLARADVSCLWLRSKFPSSQKMPSISSWPPSRTSLLRRYP